MSTIGNTFAVVTTAALLALSAPVWAQHGGKGGDVNNSALPAIPDGRWLEENPYRGSRQAMEIGKIAYDGNCARCHGIDMISGGIAPDLRELGAQYDEYTINHIRNGVQRNGFTYMPAFEDVLDQKTMWAIRSYIDKRHYEYEDKNLDELYKQWDARQGEKKSATKGSSARVHSTARAYPVADNAEPDRLEAIERSGSMEIAVYRAFPPWSYQPDDGAFTGIDVEIGKVLAEKLGVQMTIRAFTADESMGDDIRNQIWKGHYLGGGTADAMLHVGMAPAFQQANDQATFIAPYYDETMGFAYDAERLGGDVDSPLNLAGQKIGVSLDTLGDYFLTSAYQGRLRDDVEHFKSVPAAMQALNTGEVAAVMAPVGELTGTAAMLGEQRMKMRTVELGGLYQTSWDVGVAIKAGNPGLASAIRDAMRSLRDSGEIEAIFKRFGVPYRAPASDDARTAGA